jgi:peptidoglycan/LPS O-acetylase OafA/YrhL
MAPATALVAPPRLGYRPSLDGLRALSVMAVILYHAGVSWMPGGFLGVEVFFVVSGFLITTLLLEERSRSGTVDLRQFWIRRARRLLPALYLLLVVVSAVSLLAYRDAAGRLGGDVVAALAYVYNWWQILADESYFAQAGRPPVLQHLWSLAVEEQFYLLFPPLFALGLVKLGHLRVRLALLVTALASAAWMALLYEPFVDTSRVYYGTDTRLSGLLLGAFLATVWAPWRSRTPAAPAAGPVLDVAGLAGLVAIGWFLTRVNAFDPFIYRGGFLLLGVVCIVVIAVLVHPATRLSRVLGWAPLVWVGLRSYSLYLWHWPIFVFTRPEVDVPLSGFALFVLRMLLTFAAAELSFRYVETPLRNGALGRWRAELRRSDPVRRAALVRQGRIVGGAAAAVVVLLSVGLFRAGTDPDRAEIELAATGEGSTELAGLPAGRPGDDPSAPVSAPEPTTAPTTTSPAASTPTTAPGSSVAGNGATSTTTTTAPPATSTDALAVGDSVMLGAQSALVEAMPGLRVDAKVGRQFDNLRDVVGWYASEGLIPGPLVVHAGTNGTFTDEDLDRMIGLAGERRVLLVNVKVARPWQDLVNGRLAAAARRHPNAELLDWHSLASAHPEWFADDGAHLRPAGAQAFAELIRSNL